MENDKFAERMVEDFPEMFYKPYGCEMAIGEGWHAIVRNATRIIYDHYKWKIETRKRLLENNPHNLPIPEETDFPKLTQIKEKFGGLRYYYDGGDDYCDGVSAMAEYMSAVTCETCGAPGTRRSGGWIRTLCDKHEEEYQLRKLGNQNA